MTATAKVFMSGRSQAVRLPKEFRFDVNEVMIERTADGVLLRAKTKAQLVREYFAQSSMVPADFLLNREQGVPERDDPLGLLSGSFAQPSPVENLFDVVSKRKAATARK